jgi:hypothetical protein
MIRFHNGPAHGVTLFLQRAPFFLRVTLDHIEGQKEKWDALDQPEDQATKTEALFLYRIRPTRMGRAFFDGTRNGRRAGWLSMIADYDCVTPQPPDAIMRNPESFRGWCAKQAQIPEVSAIHKAWMEANSKESEH